MNSYTCTEIINNTCSHWIKSFDMFSISVEDGLYVGGIMLLTTLVAWGFRETARFILNRK